MWHEARRQERKIRGMLVDYRRRAERRRDFYEKIKADPTQFLQVHGRQCRIHLDPNVAAAADSAVMMPWQGQVDNLIDRFDVRAHLDYIPPVKKEEDTEVSQEERQLNYERYRIIAQNSFLGITEEKFLKQLHLEEQFGYTEMKGKKEQRTGGAAIGFNYEDGTGISQIPPVQEEDESEDNNSDSDLDVDLAINVSKMDSAQAHEMNKHGRNFGMSSNDFYSFLTNDLEEAETFRLAKEEEHEKALFSGRKSRRERRAHREKRLANRVISPPSYAAQASPTLPRFRESKSRSHSRSQTPENTGKITYITSFGDDEETPSSSKPTYADKVKYGKAKNRREVSNERTVYYSRRKSHSRSRERSYGRKRRRSRSRLRRSRSKSRTKVRRSSSRSKSKKSRSRSKSRRSGSRSKSRGSRSVSRRSRSRSRRSVSRSRRSRSRSKDRQIRTHSKTRSAGRAYRNRRSLDSSSTSSESSESMLKPKSPSPERKQSSVSRSASPTRKSKSPSIKQESPPKVLPRYYGRRKSDHSSSDLSDSSGQGDVEMKPANKPVSSETKLGHGNNSGTAIKKASTSMTIIERLKRKRQALLNRQFKADKIAEQLKTEREKQEQQTREDELREMAIKLRRRQREKRHAYDSNRSSSSSDSDSSAKSRESAIEKTPPQDSREREQDGKVPKRHETRYDNRERRDSKERDRIGSQERRVVDRESRRDKDRRSVSPSRRVSRDSDRDRDRRDRWREDRDRKDSRATRSLVDY